MRSFALVEPKSPRMSSTLDAVENNGQAEGDSHGSFVSAVLWTGSAPLQTTSCQGPNPVCQAQSKPLLDSLRQWFEATLSKLSRKSETTVAIRYALSRWDALTRYIEDGTSRSTTTQPNALCAAWLWAGRTTCSRDRIRVASVPQPSTA